MIHGFDARILLFDLDGTLVDSTRVVERQWAVWADRHQLPLERILAICHGRPSLETMRLIAPELKNLEAEARDHLRREEEDRDVEAVPGARELLLSIPAANWAIVTSCSRGLALARLEAASLPLPSILVTSDRVKRGKPDPEGYLLAANEIGADPGECLVIEDTPVGIAAGRAAGMSVLGVGMTFGCANLPQADACIGDFRNSRTEQFHPLSRAAWREWLSLNHQNSRGIWLIFYKKRSGKPTVAYDEVVEEALCFGWIDSVPNKLDDARGKLWLAPRKRKSAWSKLNKTRIERLMRAGLMMPAGLAKVEAAQQDGAWTALDQIEELIPPEDLVQAFERAKTARRNFEGFPPSARKGILQWIISAKRPETRKARIAQTVRMARIGLRANMDRDPERPVTKTVSGRTGTGADPGRSRTPRG